MSNNNIINPTALSVDRNFGYEKEIQLLPKFKKIFKDESLEKIEDRYSPLDFLGVDTRICIELKSRRIDSEKYAATIVGVNKIKFIEDFIYSDPELSDFKVYFCVSFTDCLCYIQYDKEVFSKYAKKICGREDRGKKEYAEYIYVDIKDCIKIPNAELERI